jgi:hypothetical protein
MNLSFGIKMLLLAGVCFSGWGILKGEERPEIQEGKAAETQEGAGKADSAEREKLYENFQKMMTKVKLVGNFTIEGSEKDELLKDEYVVEKVKKTDEGDFWVVTARIKYGNVDLSVPVPVEVKWAGKTPVITLDNITIPGLGTFSSRVVLDQGKYAGTWTHDKVGGHMFGKIVPLTEEEFKKSSSKEKSTEKSSEKDASK